MLERLADLREGYVSFALASGSVGYVCCFPRDQAEPARRSASGLAERAGGRLTFYPGRP
jgi:hypothetical protein